MEESDRRKGVVYISQWLDDAMQPVDWFILHWEDPNATPAVFYEQGPGFSTADEAIRWGRERARVVLIRVGPSPQVYYSAGDDPAGERGARGRRATSAGASMAECFSDLTEHESVNRQPK
jgi:hypothetical protein